jgi:uncharacterized protein YjlB
VNDFTAPETAVTRAALLSRSRREVESALRAEGLSPSAWGNGGDFSYGRHGHEHHKVLVCVSGSIVFHTDAGDVALTPGDRMELPAGVQHGATVGPDGVECVEAFRR